jgi:hypothetical protein
MRLSSIDVVRLLSACLMSGAYVATNGAALAGVVDVTETVANFGTYNQRAMTDACDMNPLSACGPTAVVNSFIYLQKTFPKVYDNTLVPAGGGQPQATVNTLGTYMNCNCNGEPTSAMIQGKMAYIQGGRDAGGTQRTGVLPGSTIFESQYLSSFAGAGTGTVPTLSFMVQELKKKEDVEMVIGLYTKSGDTYTRTGGHVVTLTGVAYNSASGGIDSPSSINFIDPFGTNTNLNGALTISDADLTSVTTQYGSLLDISNYFAKVDNPGWGSRTDANTYVLIDGLVAESPVPEPSTWALMAAGFAGLALAGRRGVATGRRAKA